MMVTRRVAAAVCNVIILHFMEGLNAFALQETTVLATGK